jgi:hypothetical protein
MKVGLFMIDVVSSLLSCVGCVQLATNERAAKHEADLYMQNGNWSSLVSPRGTQPHLALY